MKLRLGSYNIHKCVGVDRRRLPERSLEAINALDADIVALQEVDRRLGDRPAALSRRRVEAGSDFQIPAFDETDVSLGWHGGTVLVRRGIGIARTERLTLPGLEPRGAVILDLMAGDSPLRIVGVHLGLFRRHRILQLEAIRAALGEMPAMPTVIMGDFNEWSARGGMEPLADAFHVHAPGQSFHSRRPMAALDRFAVGADVHLRDAGVKETALTKVASDHLPVWAEVRLDGAG